MTEREAPGEEERHRHAGWEMLEECRGPLARLRATLPGRARGDAGSEEDEETTRETPARLDAVDVLAFIIAFFQLLLPPFLVMVGVLVLLYLLIRLWAGV
ncbi:MAG: hypothetical protein RDU89_03560 [bacterium]|nr:hypothetical protein [bacterium]